MAHADIADELEKISNEVSYFVEARANSATVEPPKPSVNKH